MQKPELVYIKLISEQIENFFTVDYLPMLLIGCTACRGGSMMRDILEDLSHEMIGLFLKNCPFVLFRRASNGL